MLSKVQLSTGLVNFRANEESKINIEKINLGKMPTPAGTPKAEAERRRLLMGDGSVINIHTTTKPLPDDVESKLKPRKGMEILIGLKSNFDAAVEAAEKAGLDAKNLEALRKLPKFLMTLLLNAK